MTASTSTGLRSLLADPDAGYESLSATYQPVFDRIGEGDLARERAREFPYEQVRQLVDAGFSRLRIPRELGGDGATLQQLFRLLADLGAADPNVAHIFRNHLAFVEDRLNSPEHPATEIWLDRFRRGEFVGGGWTEANNAKFGDIGTRISTVDGVTRVTGEKFYATGSLYADWLDVIGKDADDRLVTVLVARHQPGVTLVDDWTGFGQQTTASGSARYHDAVVDEHGLFPAEERFAYQGLFYQTALLSVLTGIARAAFRDGAAALRRRPRNYPLGIDEVPARDPLLQQRIGVLAGRVFAAEAALEKQAATLDAVAEAHFRRDAEAEQQALVQATVRTHEAQTVVIEAALEVTATVFDALGASATAVGAGLDRHWRNARTLASHNPRVFKERVLGDYYINGTPPAGGSNSFLRPQGQGA
ncbi:acyl-CoA dehydrogenase family protein [Nocardia carnea]|uniref:acyl-CoA dehydrogenase family protein n=1 Tax=Nocardia carnea TaxID=37328 RepID=UPI002457F50D|nr:acyl-CoA dehydrogenase family protein [Nocardia carnea]